MKIENKKQLNLTSKLIVYILFGLTLALELTNVILCVAQSYNKIHWLVFFYNLVLLLLTIGSFLFYWFKKITWMRAFISIILFIQIAYTIAYSFIMYPKTPGVNYTSFVFYIIYACLILTFFITSLVLHAHLNQERDNAVFKAIVIEGFIFALFSAVFFISSLITLCESGYKTSLLIDMLSYSSTCFIFWYFIHIEKISMPLTIDKYYKESKTKK